eukprot:4638394-Prymnesium_polylepis.1
MHMHMHMRRVALLHRMLGVLATVNTARGPLAPYICVPPPLPTTQRRPLPRCRQYNVAPSPAADNAALPPPIHSVAPSPVARQNSATVGPSRCVAELSDRCSLPR